MANTIEGQNEGRLIGALIVCSSEVMQLCDKRKVTDAWFTTPEAQRIWPVLMQQWQSEKSLDGYSAAQEAKLPPSWVKEQIANAPILAHVPRLIENLAQAFLTRKIQESALDIHEEASKSPLSALTLMSEKSADLGAMESSLYPSLETNQHQMDEILEEFQLLRQKRVIEGDKSFRIGLRLPWEILDLYYNGVKPGIHIIAARPSQGKTAFAVCMSAGMAQLNGVKQLFFSLDMSEKELRKRYISLLGQVSLARLENGASAEELEKAQRGRARFSCLNPKEECQEMIVFSSTGHIDGIIGEIYRAVRHNGVQCVWIDYLQQCSGETHHRYNSQKAEIDAVLMRLKQCALDLKIPIFCLAQLNRESEKDSNQPPILSNLGDSGRIERDASTVLVLWRDSDVTQIWDEHPPLDLAMKDEALAKTLRPMWLCLLKNQQGAQGKFPFVFYPTYFMFRPADDEAKPSVTKGTLPYFMRIRDDFLQLEGEGGERMKQAGMPRKRGQ